MYLGLKGQEESSDKSCISADGLESICCRPNILIETGQPLMREFQEGSDSSFANCQMP